MACAPGDDAPLAHDGNNIRVAVRCRPFSAREIELAAEAAEQAVACSPTTVSFGEGAKSKCFAFDHVFRCEDTQANVFDAIGVQLLENALNAYNGCIFAYGQTGSGKSYSVVGNLVDDAEKGILPRACVLLFDMLSAKQKEDDQFQSTVLASYLEIYNEKVYDLLSGGRDTSSGGGELQMRFHPQLGAIVVNLTECPMLNFQEALELFDFGAKKRAVGATQMNASSSRSHAVFTIQIRMVIRKPAGAVESQAKIHFVDLAGSEKQKKTGATGDRLKEGIGINQSLSTLGRVISDLTKAGHKGLPPFRDSKLTMLLKDALMGNSRTELLACISPSKFNLEETISTLEFAARCKLVKTSAKKNEQSRKALIDKLTTEKEMIEAQLQQEKAYSEELGSKLQTELDRAAEKQRAAEQALREKEEIEDRLRQLEGRHEELEAQKEEMRRKQSLLRQKEELLASQKVPSEQADQPEALQVGMRVFVTVKSQQLTGIVRHTGQVEFTSGHVVGVELDEKLGKNDGSVEGKRYFSCAQDHGIYVRPEMVTPVPATNPIVKELQVRLEEIRAQQQAQLEETQREQEERKRLEDEHRARQLYEKELISQIDALKGVQESWALDQTQLNTRRREQHERREAELSKLGMHVMGVELEDMPHAPKLVNLHPDPALKGCLVYYLPAGETSIGSDFERCRVKLSGLNIGAQVCVVTNEDNVHLSVRPLDGGLVRVNGSMVSEHGQVLGDGDRLVIGRAYIFQVQVPLDPRDKGAESHLESEFERAMGELSACAEVDPQWENGVQKAMLLVKTDFGTEAANKLLEQAKKASEAIAMANVVLQEMPEGWTDGVTKFELSVLFNAHGLPDVCIVARRGASCDNTFAGAAAGMWEVEHFTSERLPAMHEALVLAQDGVDEPSRRSWEARVWSEVHIEDYKSIVEELCHTEARVQLAEARAEAGHHTATDSASWGWFSGAASKFMKHNLKAMQHAVPLPHSFSPVSFPSGDGDAGAAGSGFPKDSKGIFNLTRRPGGTRAARGLMRAASPARLVRSVSTGKLEGSGRTFEPEPRSRGGQAFEPEPRTRGHLDPRQESSRLLAQSFAPPKVDQKHSPF